MLNYIIIGKFLTLRIAFSTGILNHKRGNTSLVIIMMILHNPVDHFELHEGNSPPI